MIESRVRNSGRWITRGIAALACASALYGIYDNIKRGSTGAEFFKDNEVVSEYLRAVESRERIKHIHCVFNEVVRSEIAPKRTDFPYAPEDAREDLETIARTPEEVMDSLDTVKESISRDVARMEETPEVNAYLHWRNDAPVIYLALAAALGIASLFTGLYIKLMGYMHEDSPKEGGE